MAPQAGFIPNYEEEYMLAEAIEEYYQELDAALAKYYATTDAQGTTVLAGQKGLADAQRREDERRGGFAAMVCGYGKP